MNPLLEHQRIARLAYQIWEDEGRPEGRSEVHWREAEQKLRVERDPAADTARDTRPVPVARPAAAMHTR